jgi:hypothetical protein
MKGTRARPESNLSLAIFEESNRGGQIADLHSPALASGASVQQVQMLLARERLSAMTCFLRIGKLLGENTVRGTKYREI